MYKIRDNKLERIAQTAIKLEGKLEEDLETWVESDPSILGEDLFIIGRQVPIPEVNDRIDLLALDVNGNTVIIELKRGKLKDPVDIQALRYAAYISNWEYAQVEEQAKKYFSEKGEQEFNFNEKFEEFLSNAGIDGVPELINQDQRIVILGSHTKEKLGAVALWLRKHRIDIKVIEFSLFKDGETYYLSPQVIIPLPTADRFEIGKGPVIGDRPWVSNGQEWHLDKRCGKAMKEKLLQLNSIIAENFEEVEGPLWEQKFYVSFKVGSHIWLYVNTHRTTLKLNFVVGRGDMKSEDISRKLGVKVFDKTSSLSEKLQLESSVEIITGGEQEIVRLRIKEEFNISTENFVKFIRDCFSSFKKATLI